MQHRKSNSHIRKDDEYAVIFGADGVLDGHFDVVECNERGACRGRIHRLDWFCIDAFATFDQDDGEPFLDVNEIRIAK